jgi:hypothetical protein
MSKPIVIICPHCAQIRKIDPERFGIKCNFCERAFKVRVKEMKQDFKHYDRHQKITPDKIK